MQWRLTAILMLVAPLRTLGTSSATFTIHGGRILFGDSPVRIGGGVNAMHTFTLGKESDYALLKEWNVGIVREFIGNLRENPLAGQWATCTSNGQWLWPLQAIVDLNRANNLVTILCPFGWVDEEATWTLFSGKFPTDQAFYSAYKVHMQALAEQFKNQTDVWVEIWNEPYPWDNSGGYTDDTWLADTVDMVENLRNVSGFDNIIVVQGNGQGQLEDAILNKGGDLLALHRNILFDLHGYEKWMIGASSTLDSQCAHFGPKSSRVCDLIWRVWGHQRKRADERFHRLPRSHVCWRHSDARMALEVR